MSCVLALECSICMENMTIKDLTYTPCSHAFHIKCITEWLERIEKCPECRQFLSVKQVRRLYVNVTTVDLNLEEISKLSYNVNYMKSQLVKKDNEIVGLKSNLEKYKCTITSNPQMIMERAKEQEKKESEANAIITALRKELETMATKLKLEHSLNTQLNVDLRVLKNRCSKLKQKIKSLKKPTMIKMKSSSSESDESEPIASCTRSETVAKK